MTNRERDENVDFSHIGLYPSANPDLADLMKKAERRGAERMREKAANLIAESNRHDHTTEYCMICGMAETFSKKIRALPLE